MTDNNNNDRERIMREARQTLATPPDYLFRRAFLDKPGAPDPFFAPEPAPFVPAPARSPRLDTAPERRQAQPATENWEAWI